MTASPRQPGTPPNAAVAVFGEALVDAYPDGSAVPGGAPFNVARWLAAFGVPVLLVSRIGHGDAAAGVVRAAMQRFGLRDDALQVDAQRPTGVVRVVPDSRPGAGGHRFEIADHSAWDAIEAAPALPLLRALAPAVLYFGTLALRQPASRQALADLAAATPALHLADLNLRDVPGLQALAEQALRLADWVKVNDEELNTLLGWFVGPAAQAAVPGSAAHADALHSLSHRFGVQRWIVTRGERGWCTLDADGREDGAGPAAALSAMADTVGAGDAFAATVLAGLALGWPLARSLQAANRLAAAVCSWRGALPADDAVLRHWCTTLGFPGPAPNNEHSSIPPAEGHP